MRPEPARDSAGTYTGVAGGSLGTAANLEDTQVYQLDDLQEPELEPELASAPAPEPERFSAPAAAPDVASTPAPVVFAAPVSPSRPTTRATTSRTPSRPITAGALATAALVAVIGGAVLLSLANGGADPRIGSGAGGTETGQTAAPTIDAATQPPEAGGGGGNGHGNGGGNGHGNGGGNGH